MVCPSDKFANLLLYLSGLAGGFPRPNAASPGRVENVGLSPYGTHAKRGRFAYRLRTQGLSPIGHIMTVKVVTPCAGCTVFPAISAEPEGPVISTAYLHSR